VSSWIDRVLWLSWPCKHGVIWTSMKEGRCWVGGLGEWATRGKSLRIG
jgi:hypothetical protein